MKKYLPILLALSLLVLTSIACRIVIPEVSIGSTGVTGSGEVIEDARRVSGISRVRVANQGDLFIALGSEEKLVIEAEDNLLEYIESDVRGGELVLSTRSSANIRNTKPIRYYLTVINLDGLSVSSSGTIEAPELQSNKFSIVISSSGDIKIDGLMVNDLDVKITSSGSTSIEMLDAERLEVLISSSGKLTIQEGEVDEQDIMITSSGDYEAGNLVSQRTEVRLSSSGNATVQVKDELRGSLSSSGNLFYYGNPTVNVSQSSSGDVIHRGD